MQSKVFSIRSQYLSTDVVFLFLRLACGYAMALHGWGKIQSPMNWMGPTSPVPAIFQFLAAFAEFGGGIALMLGFLTRLSAFGIFCTMVVAALFHKVGMGDPFVSATGGSSYELAAIYLLISLLFVIQGPGRFSLDRFMFGTTST